MFAVEKGMSESLCRQISQLKNKQNVRSVVCVQLKYLTRDAARSASDPPIGRSSEAASTDD